MLPIQPMWQTAALFLLPVVQCPKVDEDHSTRSPNQDFYDFNTTVEYSCVIGYNMTGGDAVRTCNYTGTWTNTPPVCTSKITENNRAYCTV